MTISKLAANVRTRQSHAIPSSLSELGPQNHRHSRCAMRRSLHHRLWQQLYRCITNIQNCLQLRTHIRVHSASAPHLLFSPGKDTVTGHLLRAIWYVCNTLEAALCEIAVCSCECRRWPRPCPPRQSQRMWCRQWRSHMGGRHAIASMISYSQQITSAIFEKHCRMFACRRWLRPTRSRRRARTW